MKHVRHALSAAVLLAAIATGLDAQRAGQSMRAVPSGNPGDWFPSDDYPNDAISAGRAGAVSVELGIDSSGAVSSCRVVRSSGTTALDQKTCELARARGRFDPATDRKGRPTAGSFRLRVRWVVPAPDTAVANAIEVGSRSDIASETEWTIDPEGIVESCRIISPATGDTGDDCKRYPVGRPWGAHYTQGGQPVRVRVRDRFIRQAEVVALPK